MAGKHAGQRLAALRNARSRGTKNRARTSRQKGSSGRAGVCGIGAFVQSKSLARAGDVANVVAGNSPAVPESATRRVKSRRESPVMLASERGIMPRMSRTRLAAAFVAMALSASAVIAQDWPQFRGPTGQGVSEARGLPLEWSESKNIVWKVPVPGNGWSSPVIAGGRVWMTTYLDKGASMRVLAFDVESGT